MPELRMNDGELAAACADLGRQIAWPAAPDVRARVLARIQAKPRRAPWWRAAWSPRYGFAPAIVTVALALVAVLVFSPEARATATDILRLRGVQIFRGPVPTPSPTPSRSPGSIPSPTPSPALALGTLVTLDEARARAGYPVVAPADALLGGPDEIYVRPVTNSTAVSFVYKVRPGIPLSAEAGVAAVVTEFGGGTVDEQFFGKVLGADTTLEKVVIDGEPGFWIQGKPHFFFYRAAGSTGSVDQETLRLAGNTLIWQRQGLLVRLEAQVDKATALRIAASFR
jgi:hypothetical protein